MTYRTHLESLKDVTTEEKKWVFNVRYLIGILMCFAFVCVHIMNTSLSMGITYMINDTYVIDITGNGSTCGIKLNQSTVIHEDRSHEYDGPLKWCTETQGIILASHNIGRLSMVFTGLIADKFNTKYLLILSMILTTGANLAFPKLSMTDNIAYPIALRIIVGIGDGFVQPSVNSLISLWFAVHERSTAMALVTGGRQIGSLIILPLSGVFIENNFLGGWPAIFYMPAILSVLWLILWIPLGADKPSHHWFITHRERRKLSLANSSEKITQKRRDRKIPWCSILTSKAVWAATISIICLEIPFMTFAMFLPMYMRDVMNFSPANNGMVSALPTGFYLVTKLLAARFARWLVRDKRYDPTIIARILNAIGSMGLSVFLFAVTFLDKSQAAWAVVFLCVSLSFTGLHTPGCNSALVSIAPAFSGSIAGIAFALVALSCSSTAYLIKLVTKCGSQKEWNLVFYCSAAIALIPVVVFSLFGSANLQPWATESEEIRNKQKELTLMKLQRLSSNNAKISDAKTGTQSI